MSDVYGRQNKTYEDYLSDFCNYDISKYFGINIIDYLNHSPKDIIIMNKVARNKQIKEMEETQRELKSMTFSEG